MVTKKIVKAGDQEVVFWHYTRQEMWDELVEILGEKGMTVEEFRAEGEADTLKDASLRKLWLEYKYVINW